jgi:hypothetical protein
LVALWFLLSKEFVRIEGRSAANTLNPELPSDKSFMALGVLLFLTV